MGSLGLADDVKTHAVSSLLAGTMATTICAPADVLKSRLQSSAGKSVQPPKEALGVLSANRLAGPCRCTAARNA
jgi:hypothetical protein